MRDIGGYNSEYGIIKYNMVIRGGLPYNISLKDKEKFSKLDLNPIDIRSDKEKKRKKTMLLT